MWIRRADFVSLVRETEAERFKVEKLEAQLAALAKRNLELQDLVTSLSAHRTPNRFDFDDPLDEDPEDVAKILEEIKQHGRDAVLMREVRNERVG